MDSHIKDRIRRLENLGFIMDAEEYLFEEVCTCLRIFLSKNGHLKVPSSYSIPTEDGLPWPQHYKGKSLGQIVQAIRNGKFNSENHRRKLREMGFLWKGETKDSAFNAFMLALDTHFALFGDHNVPRYFQVPASSEWPVETWGMQLGYLVNNFKHGKSFSSVEYRRRLIDHGIVF